MSTKLFTVPERRPLTSTLDPLVASGRVWRPIERLDAPPGGVMDLVVTEVARSHFGTLSAAVRHLNDPATWAALQRAAGTAFPNDPGRRMAPTPPTRHRHYMIRQRLTGEIIDQWQRGVRHEAVDAALHIGNFDPARGTWTHPDPTQIIVGDMTWIPARTGPHRSAAPNKQGHSNRVVVLSAGSGPIILDTELADHHPGRRGNDLAVDMLRRLLDEHGAPLQGGLRGFAHDMSLSAANIDDVMGMRVLPITKVRRLRGGAPARGWLGMLRFTAPDGSRYIRPVHAIGGAPVVVLPDSGTSTAVALKRQRTCWAAKGGRRVIACGRYEIPSLGVVPARLRGATTIIRLMSTRAETQARPDTRRTRSLRPIPETDPDFERLYGVRESLEAAFADLRRHVGRPRGTADTRLRMLIHQIVSIESALAARNGR